MRGTEENSGQRDYSYSAISIMPANILVHIYWIGGTPSDEIRDQCYGFILVKAEHFYRDVAE